MLIRFSLSKVSFYSVCLSLILVASATALAVPGNNKSNGSNRKGPLWTEVVGSLPLVRDQRLVSPDRYRVVRLNRSSLDEQIARMPLEFTEDARNRQTILDVPMPDGTMSRFRIEDSPMLAPHIAAQFPTWKQFSGQGIDDPTAIARFDVNDLGFHGYILGAKGTVLIDPYSLTDQKNYIVYFKGDIGESNKSEFECKVKEDIKWRGADSAAAPQAFTIGTQLRTYRIAVAATKEYTNFFGGNTATAFANIQITVNRMITIYRRDLASTFVLVTGVNHVFTNANNGGYVDATDPNVSSLSIDRNQVVMDMGNTANPGNPGPVGNANYDIGHVLSRTPNPNGVASSPSLCNDSNKAKGFTGAQTPQGDGFDVDYVAHEIGHQFNMSHTFNNNIDGTCNTRSATSAYEPASGVTIMGYAGICAPRNLSANSIEYFNLRSFDQSLSWFQDIANGTFGGIDQNCGGVTGPMGTPPPPSGNTVPTFPAPPGNFTIPRLTPFTLTAAATDANNDPITYLWEEFDLGAPTNSMGAVDDDAVGGARPIFRAYNASTSGSRTFPTLNYILDPATNDPAGSNQPSLTYTGTLPNAPGMGSTNGYVCPPMQTCTRGERLPNIGRTMVFRVVARDNRAASGAASDATSTVTVAPMSGPFRVTAPDVVTVWQGGSTKTVTWDVANTSAAPVSTANVNIRLSTDGGLTFPTTLLANAPNNGTANVVVPNTPTNTARVKIEGAGNIFFDISNVNFFIVPDTAAPANVSGRIATADGRGISRVIVTLTDQNGVVRRTTSSAFGYYRFEDVGVGETYVLTVASKRYTFAQPSRIVTVQEDVGDADFVSNE